MKHTTRLADSAFTEGLTVTAARKKANAPYSLHGHDFYELDIVVGGEAHTLLNNESWDAKAGMVFFLTPEDFHAYHDCQDFTLYNLHFTADHISPSLLARMTEMGSRVYVPSQKDFAFILRLAEDMEKLLEAPAPNGEVLNRLLECVLLLLSESDKGASSLPTMQGGMQQAVLFIHAHFKEDPSLSAAADALHLNEKYFCKRFKEYTGKTYKEFLRERKLRYAARLVLATSLPITRIAQESGYTSLSHFNREFKAHYGLSPLAMRKKEK
ncbi:MAG: helix-turn-helix domain-containing protein [Clostridia bacterium]|nr:helix-turn-helix domain-containing protein [Clostridia bacterium]MBO5755440.1 helix-turn-helix domain-containing protein [Clostridia bacterium]